MNSSLADETGELSCSTQVLRREANHLKSHKVPICHVSQQAGNTDSTNTEQEAYKIYIKFKKIPRNLVSFWVK